MSMMRVENESTWRTTPSRRTDELIAIVPGTEHCGQAVTSGRAGLVRKLSGLCGRVPREKMVGPLPSWKRPDRWSEASCRTDLRTGTRDSTARSQRTGRKRSPQVVVNADASLHRPRYPTRSLSTVVVYKAYLKRCRSSRKRAGRRRIIYIMIVSVMKYRANSVTSGRFGLRERSTTLRADVGPFRSLRNTPRSEADSLIPEVSRGMVKQLCSIP